MALGGDLVVGGGVGGDHRAVAAMSGGRYLAEDRGAFDQPLVIEMEPEPEVVVATAPLYEIAAAHDGQPPRAWLLHLMRIWGDLD